MPENYELTDKGLVTADPQIVAGYLGANLTDGWGSLNIWHESEEWGFTLRNGEGEEKEVDEITIPYPLIWQEIQPVKGEGFVRFYRLHPFAELIVYQNYNGQDDVFHKRVLNIVTTRAELRDLVKHVEAAKG